LVAYLHLTLLPPQNKAIKNNTHRRNALNLQFVTAYEQPPQRKVQATTKKCNASSAPWPKRATVKWDKSEK
jgi:hypothetical protein